VIQNAGTDDAAADHHHFCVALHFKIAPDSMNCCRDDA
jgi:hypothetical protein